MISCEYCKILENIYFEEHLRTAASDLPDNTKLCTQNKLTLSNVRYVALREKCS